MCAHSDNNDNEIIKKIKHQQTRQIVSNRRKYAVGFLHMHTIFFASVLSTYYGGASGEGVHTETLTPTKL